MQERIVLACESTQGKRGYAPEQGILGIDMLIFIIGYQYTYVYYRHIIGLRVNREIIPFTLRKFFNARTIIWINDSIVARFIRVPRKTVALPPVQNGRVSCKKVAIFRSPLNPLFVFSVTNLFNKRTYFCLRNPFMACLRIGWSFPRTSTNPRTSKLFCHNYVLHYKLFGHRNLFVI